MLFSSFVAARYLKPKRTFVSIITLISIIGVALGVWLLAVVIAVFTGYGERIKESIIGFDPHLILNTGGIVQDWPETYEKVRTEEFVESASPFVSGRVLMQFTNARGTFRDTPMVRGILPPEGDELERFQDMIATMPDPESFETPQKKKKRGEFDINSFYSAVIGDGMAETYGLDVGDTFLLYAPGDFEAIFDALNSVENSDSDEARGERIDEVREMTAPQELTVTGIFDSGYWEFDTGVIFTHLETAQVLHSFDLDECHGIALRTVDPFQADSYKDQLYSDLPQHFRVLTWMEMKKVIFDAIAAERQAMYLILFMIMIVSGFCIMNTMITVTFQKRSEIGLMKALGANRSQVAWVFVFKGFFIGITGVITGLIVAQITIHFRNHVARFIGKNFGVDIFSAEIYQIEGGLPAEQSLQDLAIISTGAFAACIIASVIPALIAASLQPAKALRSE